jgi:type IV pilus assembly protein PilB
MGNRIGELLVREKLISLQQLRTAQEESRKGNTSLGYQLARLGFISDSEITDFLSQQYRVQSINLDEYDIEDDVTEADLAGGLRAPQDHPRLAHRQLDHRGHGGPVEPARDRRHQVPHWLQRRARRRVDDVNLDRAREGLAEGAPVIRLCQRHLAQRHQEGRERTSTSSRTRRPARALPHRRRAAGGDAAAHQAARPPSARAQDHEPLDIAERRVPQDGRIKLKMGKGKEMDFRVSVAADDLRARRSSSASSTSRTCSST